MAVLSSVRRTAYAVAAGAWLVAAGVAAPAGAQETAIREAFQAFQVAVGARPGPEPTAEPAHAFSAHLYQVGRYVWGHDTLDPAAASFATLYSVYITRGIFVCAFLNNPAGAKERAVDMDPGDVLWMSSRVQMALPWIQASEELRDIAVSGDRARAIYAWRRSAQGNHNAFEDALEFVRESQWRLDYRSYDRMIERNFRPVVASMLGPVYASGAGPGVREFGAIDIAVMRVHSFFLARVCGISRDRMEKWQAERRDDRVEEVRVGLYDLIEAPVRDWTTPDQYAWWSAP